MPTFREDPKLGSKVPMIKTADLNEQCVTNSKILDGCITKEKLAKGTVDATTLANKSVGTEKLSDSSVTNEKISNKAVSTEKLADGSITKEKIFNASITTEKLANESVSAEKLQSGLRNTIASTYDKTIELDNQKANIADVGNAIERLENKIGERFIVEGDVTNLPDEEDLTSVSTIDGREVMKLNDRAYEPSNFSGKGYKILRKNIKKFDIPTVDIVVSYAPTSSGDITITINGKQTTISLDIATDTTTAIVATKIAAALKSSLDDYDVSVSSNRITLMRHNDSSVSPSSINVGDTSAVISVTDSVNKNVRKNVLTDEMIGKPNTIYEIKYDFDLLGITINIPNNCILKFNGGSFNNGKITGTVGNTYVKPEWFSQDDTIGLTIALNVASKVLLTKKEYYIKSIDIPSNVTLTSIHKSIIHYDKITSKENVNISNIIFDGDWDCSGLWILDNTNIYNCEFINTRNVSFDAKISYAISVGTFYTEQEKRFINNVKIDSCVFDGIKAHISDPDQYGSDYLNSEQSNPYTSRFILSYSCRNLRITNSVFKNMNSIYEADMIQLRSHKEKADEFPYNGESDLWTSSNYPKDKYVEVETYITNNTFICGRIKSAIKVMAKGAIISNNTFICKNDNTKRNSYAIIRNEGGTSNINNNIFIVNTNNTYSLFRFSQTSNCSFNNNIIASNTEINETDNSVFSIYMSDNITICNNTISTNNLNNFYSTECDGKITISNNNISLTYNTVKDKIKWNSDIDNHYSFPDQRTMGIFNIENNIINIKCSSNVSTYVINNYRENGLNFIKNKINFIGHTPDLYIEETQKIIDKENICTNILDNISNIPINIFSDTIMAYNKDFYSEFIIKQNNINQINVIQANVVIENCTFLNSTLSYFVVLNKCKNIYIKNNTSTKSTGYFFKVTKSSCKFQFINNNCKILNAYLTDGGEVSKESTYIPGTTLVKNFDIGTLENRDSLSNSYKIIEGHRFIVTDEVGGLKIYYAHIYSNGSIDWYLSQYKGTINERPSTISEGICYWDTTNKRPMWKKYKSSDTWVNGDGEIIAKKSGESTERPNNVDTGYCFFDTTINKPIWWTGIKWVDTAGTDI